MMKSAEACKKCGVYSLPPCPVCGGGGLPDQDVKHEINSGPGTELKKLLSWFGEEEDDSCECRKRTAKMNRWGVSGCRQNKQEIVGWLEGEFEKRHHKPTLVDKMKISAAVDAAILMAQIKRV